MKPIDKPSIIQNGMTHAECAAFFDLLTEAERWREQMVSSNRPYGGYPSDDRDGVAYWRNVNNCNGRLVQAVDRIREIVGSTMCGDS